MSYSNFIELAKDKTANIAMVPAAFAYSEDLHSIEAGIKVFEDGIVDPIFIGDKDKISEVIKSLSKNPDDYKIGDVKDGPEACVQKACDLVNSGDAKFIVKGLCDSSILLKSVLRKANNLRTDRIVATLNFMQIPNYHKIICLSDGGTNIYPDLDQKKKIIEVCVDGIRRFGADNPKVAVICAVEKENPKMKETVEARQLKEMNERDEIANCIVEGPISFDIAMNAESAAIKGFKSPVAGDADILLLPDITAANATTKAIIRCGGILAGIVAGLKVPLVMVSRGSSWEEKYYSIILAATGNWTESI